MGGEFQGISELPSAGLLTTEPVYAGGLGCPQGLVQDRYVRMGELGSMKNQAITQQPHWGMGRYKLSHEGLSRCDAVIHELGPDAHRVQRGRGS